jgi:hypothetical protein
VTGQGFFPNLLKVFDPIFDCRYWGGREGRQKGMGFITI